MTLNCITNDISGLRSCTVFGEHVDDCERPNCTGCVPRSAKVGILCMGCWLDLGEAVSDWAAAAPLLTGIKRAITPEPGSAHAGPRLPLTPLEQDLDAVLRLHQAITWPLTAWVATEEGAANAVRLARQIRYTLDHHPVREQPHAIARTRCPECSLLTLVYHPASHAGDIPTVVCSNCGNTLEHRAYEALALIEAQCCRRCRGDACSNTGCACHRFAPVAEWERTSKGVHVAYDPEKDPRQVELFDDVVRAAAVRWNTKRAGMLAFHLPYSEERIAAALERLADHPDLKDIRSAA